MYLRNASVAQWLQHPPRIKSRERKIAGSNPARGFMRISLIVLPFLKLIPINIGEFVIQIF